MLSVLYSQLISNLAPRPNVYKDLRSISNTFICLDVLESRNFATKAKAIFVICFFEQIFYRKKSLVHLNSAVLILSVAVQWWMHRDRSLRDLYKFCVQNEANRKIFDLFEVNRPALENLNYTCIISLQILLSATCFSTTGRNLWCLVPGFIFLFKRWCVWLLLALVCRSLSLSFHKHLR